MSSVMVLGLTRKVNRTIFTTLFSGIVSSATLNYVGSDNIDLSAENNSDSQYAELAICNLSARNSIRKANWYLQNTDSLSADHSRSELQFSRMALNRLHHTEPDYAAESVQVTAANSGPQRLNIVFPQARSVRNDRSGQCLLVRHHNTATTESLVVPAVRYQAPGKGSAEQADWLIFSRRQSDASWQRYQGLLPVVRFELADGQQVSQAIARIDPPAREEFETANAGVLQQPIKLSGVLLPGATLAVYGNASMAGDALRVEVLENCKHPRQQGAAAVKHGGVGWHQVTLKGEPIAAGTACVLVLYKPGGGVQPFIAKRLKGARGNDGSGGAGDLTYTSLVTGVTRLSSAMRAGNWQSYSQHYHSSLLFRLEPAELTPLLREE